MCWEDPFHRAQAVKVHGVPRRCGNFRYHPGWVFQLWRTWGPALFACSQVLRVNVLKMFFLAADAQPAAATARTSSSQLPWLLLLNSTSSKPALSNTWRLLVFFFSEGARNWSLWFCNPFSQLIPVAPSFGWFFRTPASATVPLEAYVLIFSDLFRGFQLGWLGFGVSPALVSRGANQP